MKKRIIGLLFVLLFAFAGACSAERKAFQWEKVGKGEFGVVYFDTAYLERLQVGDMPYIKCITKEVDLDIYYLEQLRAQKGCSDVEYIMTVYNFQPDTATYRIATKFLVDSNNKVSSKLPTDGFWYKANTNEMVNKIYNITKKYI